MRRIHPMIRPLLGTVCLLSLCGCSDSSTKPGGTQALEFEAIRSGISFQAIWSDDSGRSIAVGSGLDAAHFDGQEWKRRSLGGAYNLRDVWATSVDDAWAVGNDGAVLHFDGSSWAERATIDGANLSSVWVSPSGLVWATGGENLYLIDGPTYNTIPFDVMLSSVRGVSDDQVYVGGLQDRIYGGDGETWSLTFGGTVGSSSSAELAEAGGRIFALVATGFIERTGDAWDPVLVATEDSPPFHDFSIASSQEIHVVDGRGGRSVVYEWDGNGWELLVDVPAKDMLLSESPKGLLTVDASGVARRESEDWVTERVAEFVAYSCVSIDSRGRLALGSNSGTLSLWDGSSWSNIEIDQGAARVEDIEFFDDETILVALADGRLGWYDNSTWTFYDLGGPVYSGVASIWCDRAGTAFASTYDGAVFQYDGASWIPEEAEGIRYVWGWASGGQPHVLGSGYALGVRGANGSWSSEWIPCDSCFRGITGSGPNDAIAFGLATAWIYEASGWVVSDPPITGWTAAAGGVARGAFAVRDYSSIVQYEDGATETLLEAPGLYLTGIDMRKTEFGPDVVAVGSPGIVY
ncbi:MAG: hypothetical protein KDA27_28380, partial [Candidatus Eisenbacteria bacterium]|nr:hypothetical protein [Candidatus Eisenbacteria bacterium]